MEDDPAPRKLKLGEARFESLNQPPQSGGGEARIDVHQILKANLEHSVPVEKPLDLTRRPSRRKRDYLWTMLLSNGLYILLYFVFPRSVVMLLFLLSGIVVTNIAIAWVLLFIAEE